MFIFNLNPVGCHVNANSTWESDCASLRGPSESEHKSHSTKPCRSPHKLSPFEIIRNNNFKYITIYRIEIENWKLFYLNILFGSYFRPQRNQTAEQTWAASFARMAEHSNLVAWQAEECVATFPTIRATIA